VSGPGKREALDALELIADNFLTVATPVQVALPELLQIAPRIRAAISERTRANLATLRRTFEALPAARVLPVEGGWSAVIQVPQLKAEEALVLELLDRDDVLVHPGYFFDFPREAYLVVSLLIDPKPFDHAIARVLARAAGGAS